MILATDRCRNSLVVTARACVWHMPRRRRRKVPNHAGLSSNPEGSVRLIGMSLTYAYVAWVRWSLRRWNRCSACCADDPTGHGRADLARLRRDGFKERL